MSRVEHDYYDVLGVPREAGARELKSAFRSLARKYHPDVAPDPTTHERFTQVVEAYNVLSNPAARLLYDRYGYVARDHGVFARASRPDAGEPPAGAALLEVDPLEAERGARKAVLVAAVERCAGCRGSGAAPTAAVATCPACGGEGRMSSWSRLGPGALLQVEACARCAGTGRAPSDRCPACAGAGRVAVKRKVRVQIPAGVRGGERIRVDRLDVVLHVRRAKESHLVVAVAAIALVLAVALFVFLLLAPDLLLGARP